LIIIYRDTNPLGLDKLNSQNTLEINSDAEP